MPIVNKELAIKELKILNQNEDVYCISVPEVGHFSLANGAIVKNCDSFRYMCLTLDQHQQGMTEEDARRGYNKVMYGSEQGFDNPFSSNNPFSGTGNKFNGRMF